MIKSRIAFLGLGLMGSGMARRLAAAGFPLTVYNRDKAKAQPFATLGARVATNPREAAVDADAVISMVADDHAARAVWLGSDGALSAMKRGTAAVESSTITPDWIQELNAACTPHGVTLVDAPVTGSKTQAAAGELNFLVGGETEAVGRIRPVLDAMGKAIVHLGPLGSGTLLKLINNFVCGVQVAALAEGIAMIERGGLSRTQALDVLTNGAPGSPLVKTVAGRMTARDYNPHFLLRLMAKDLTYAIRAAASNALELGTARAALLAFERGIANGHGELDIAALVETLRT
jgi:3-hydroxyisobutyrate dehydrogenase